MKTQVRKRKQLEEISVAEEGYIGKPEVARRIQKTTRTVSNYMAQGILPFLKLPGGRRGAVLFRWSDVVAALERLNASKSRRLLTDAAGEKVLCFRCHRPILAEEGYGADKGGIGASRFWCERCAAEGSVDNA